MGTSNSISERKDNLTSAQRRAFEQRLHSTQSRRISPGKQHGPRLASFAQEQLWFLHQLDPSDASYHRQVAFRIRGVLDRSALQKAMRFVMQRHDALRAQFSPTEAGLEAKSSPDPSFSLDTIDLSHLAGSEQNAELLRTITEAVARPFDLSTGPILRGLVARLGNDDHVFLIVLHHIAFDAWSARILAEEVFSAYKRLAARMKPDLPAIPVSYSDYAQWQRGRYDRGELDDQLEFWKTTLADPPQPLALPTDRPRSLRSTYRAETEHFQVPVDLTSSLKHLAREEGTTIFTLTLTAFMILIHRYTGVTDVLVGVPVAGRDDADTERLIGLFTNTVIMRGDLSADPTIRETVRRMHSAVIDALDNRHVPLLKVVEAVHPERDVDSNPLFRVLFNLENIPSQVQACSPLEVHPHPSDVPFVGFEWVFEASEKDGRLVAEWRYQSDLFDVDTIRRACGHYERILESMIGDLDQRISSLPILSGTEEHQILVDWNSTKAEYPHDRSVHELFEDQVERTPAAPAVTFGDETLTYRELNRRANELAHRLRRMDVGPDTPVGLCVERSNEMLVGILAILKAGGAYVPLNPALPLERLQFMATDADLRLVLTQTRLLPKLSSLSSELVCIDAAQPQADEADQQNPSPLATPDNLAYIIYTSGSTGSPKGVLVNHRGVVSYFSWFGIVFELGTNSVVLQLASFAFDLSIRDLICPVTLGAHIVMVSDTEVQDPFHLVRKMEEHGVTAFGSTPSFLSSIIDAVDRTGGNYRSLCRIFSGGEALPATLAQRILGTFNGHVRLSNEYGPTECTMTSAHHEVAEIQSDRPIVMLGRPLANVRMYVLDTHLNVLPIGIPGEIHIGGIGLARGYLNRPELTQEKFIPNPFTPGERLYKTGDLGRWLPTGDLEFLGRLDRQTKIRGFRIELGEIEAALMELPEVRRATVEVFEPTPGDRRIAAYIIPATDDLPSPDALQAKLRVRLPDYMIPNAFILLDRFPLTPRGKIDRPALPDPTYSNIDRAEEFVAPQTPAEKLIAHIWSDVLKVDRVGVNDDFFALGGHSLAAVQVVIRIRDETNAELPVRAAFEFPTVSELATYLEGVLGETVRKDGEVLPDTLDVHSEQS